MKIVYGIQATGNGHISRSRELVRELRTLGHDVRCVFSGRPAGELWGVDEFQPFTVRKGLTFAFNQGRVQVMRTAMHLDLPQFYRDIFALDLRGVDLVLSDYEPVTARAAKLRGIPSMGVGHQYAFRHPIPRVRAFSPDSIVMRSFAPVAIPVGLHWHHFGCPVLPPIIPQMQPAAAAGNGIIVVYLPFEESAVVAEFFGAFAGHRFMVFTPAQSAALPGNVTFQPLSREGFLRELRACSGVVSNAGFELAGEALSLGKKLLVKPLAGQLEQLSNALALEQAGLGRSMRTLNPAAVGAWLAAPGIAPVVYPDVARGVAYWISGGDWQDVAGLARALWAQSSFPMA